MKLSIVERLILLGVLPKEGTYITLKLVRELREDLSFNEKEHKLLNFANNEKGQMTWAVEGQNKVGNKDVKIGDKALSLVKDIFIEMDKKEKITDELFTLYEKFV